MPTSGALLINPRRRKRKTVKRRTTKKKTMTKSARSRAAKLGWARRKRAKTTRTAKARRNSTKTGMRRKTARRAYMRSNTRKGATRKTARRAYRRNTRKGAVRTAARRAHTRRRTARRNPAHKRKNPAHTRRRRSNPNILNALSTPLKRIPIVGGIAADAVQLGIPAAFGAISIEPVMFGLKYGGQYLPKPLQKLSFTIGGMVMGALVKRFLPASPEVKKQFAVALATAGGAIDYYRMKTGQGTVTSMAAAEQAGWGALEMEAMDGLGELELAMDGYGELELAMDGYGEAEDDFDDDDLDGYGSLELAMDGYGDADGFGQLEIAMDGYGDAGGYGQLELAMDGYGYGGHTPNFSKPGMSYMGFGDASAADAIVSGDIMTDSEADAILSGPGVFLGAAYGAPPDARADALRRKAEAIAREKAAAKAAAIAREKAAAKAAAAARSDAIAQEKAAREAEAARQDAIAKRNEAEKAKALAAGRAIDEAQNEARANKERAAAAQAQADAYAKKAAELAEAYKRTRDKSSAEADALRAKIKDLTEAYEDAKSETKIQVVPGAQQPVVIQSSPMIASPVAGRPHGRWWWLVKLYGYDRAMETARLPEPARGRYIQKLRATAIQNHPGLLVMVTQPPVPLPAY